MAWVHRMLSVDPETRTGVCAHCGPVRVKRRTRNTPNGKDPRYVRYACLNAEKQWRSSGKDRRRLYYQQHKGSTCERCGFVPVDLCQLDVHHRDHDRTNNDPANLETVCANCHRLEVIRRQRYAA